MSGISEEFTSIQSSFEATFIAMGFEVFPAQNVDIENVLNQIDNPDNINATVFCSISSETILDTRPDLLFSLLKSFDVNVTFIVISGSLEARNRNIDLLKSYVDDFGDVSVMLYDAYPISVVFGSRYHGLLKLIRSYFIRTGISGERFSFA